jgi:hypothetical protein
MMKPGRKMDYSSASIFEAADRFLLALALAAVGLGSMGREA